MNIVPIPDNSTGRQRVIELLRGLLDQAEHGEILGIVYAIETEGAFAYGKCNLEYPTALGLLARAAYSVNRDWDREQ